MRFQDIPGLNKIKNTLSLAVQNQHIAHAQLFVGPPGGAQLAMAHALSPIYFAQTVQRQMLVDNVPVARNCNVASIQM